MTRIIGWGICGAGESERYLERTLKEFQRLTDDTIICGNNIDEKSREMIESYGYKVIDDNRTWGELQYAIKTDFLTNHVSKLKPDYLISLDMDETFAPEFTREEAEKLTTTEEIAFNFLVVNLYGDEQHFAHSTGIQRFWNIRFYKYLPEYGLQFQRKALHCGLAPPYAYALGWHAPYYVLHYGLMLKEDRERKSERYRKYDPNKRYKGGTYYDELTQELPMRKFDPEGLLRKLKESPECQKRKPPKKFSL